MAGRAMASYEHGMGAYGTKQHTFIGDKPMAQLNDFDANKVSPNAFEPVPAAKYVAAIIESEMRDTKDGLGKYLNLKLQILVGQYQGRTLFARLNLTNSNETTVKIARAQLSSICRAVGIMQPKDSCELHNLPMTITVKCKKDKLTDEIFNEIVKYETKESGKTDPPSTEKPPWMK